jgi:AraC-like DNA-binding protein
MPSSAVRTFSDPDEYHAEMPHAHAEGVITGRGKFRVDSKTIRLDRLSLQRSAETLPRTVYSAVAPKLFGIIFATSSGQQIHINGLELAPGQFVAFRRESEGYNRTAGACQWGTIALTHDDAAVAGQTIIGRELLAPPFTHVVKPPPGLLSELLNLHEAAGRLAQRDPEILAGPEVARAIEQALTRILVLCLSEGQATEVGSAHWRHAAALRRLEDFLEENCDRTLYAAELCAATAVSDRTLRTLCHEHLGMGPTRYLWLRRMHMARRALRTADPAAATVTEIATNYGFWGFGRFAVAYRSLFGESPSATLRRPPEDPRPQKIIVSPWQFPESG